ncbi:wax ester synthase/diacylglycerol acyltransferase 11-like isoform X2 [Carya illinoinensis]|uniref:wax ester synthase/diacylglycerol acyltransferase 11-like isoform X2 n=1 Tax=Carya illinoinensis TaxID=32201 RepID=UPI001C71B435|nr:wax ester synthase/diacylglycerol acyltransferase 11-like isoform X2 [Carya illinoinensis]
MMTGDHVKASRSSHHDEEPLSPAARFFQAPRFNVYIIAIVGCKTRINTDVVKAGLEQTLVKHPRFSSKMVVDGNKYCKNKKWTQTKVNLEDHIIVPELDPNIDFPDRFVEDYVSNVTRTPLDLSKPLWELHLLNIKTSDAEAVGVFRIHHSMGDGASLISLLLACTRKTSDPEALPSVPVKKRAGSTFNSRDGFWWFFLAIWMLLRLIWNTMVDVLLFVATTLFLKDMKTPIKGAPGVELNVKKFVHQTVSLEDIKLVKNAMNMTVNDVVTGITQAGLSRYLNRRYSEEKKLDGRVKQSNSNIPKGIRLRTVILVNLRKSAGIQVAHAPNDPSSSLSVAETYPPEFKQDMADMMAKRLKTRWGNLIGYMFLPFTISLQDDPLDYVRKAKATIDRKKLSLEPIFTSMCIGFAFRIFGNKVAAAIIRRALSNITMAISGVVGAQEEISFYGHPIAYLAPFVYGPPLSLVVNYQSYVNKMTISLTVDPSVIPDPYELCNDIEESLKLIRHAVVNKGLIKDVV